MYRKPLLLFFSSFVLLMACRHEPVVPPTTGPDNPPVKTCDPDSVYFTNSVLPILNSNCALSGCHNSITQAEGIDLSSYASIMASGIIDTDQPAKSELIERVKDSDPGKRMPPPPYTPLTQQQIATLQLWIEQGARNNSCESDCDTTQFAFAAHITPILNTNCKGCHSGTNPPSNIRFDTHADVVNAVNGGRFMGAIYHQNGFSAMPKGTNKLPDCKIRQVEKWIAAGMPNN